MGATDDIDDPMWDGEDWARWGDAVKDQLTRNAKRRNMTTKSETKKPQITTPEFRVSFPNVFTPRAAAEGQEPKYSIQMLFPKTTDIGPLRQAVAAVLVEKFGADKTKWPKNLKLPFRDGAEKDYEGYGPGVVFISATSKMKPGLVDQNVQPILDPNEFYAGCYARATVSAYYYDRAGNKGVSFGLRNIQKLRDGEAIAGKNKPENDFDAIPMPDGASKAQQDEDPLAGIGA